MKNSRRFYINGAWVEPAVSRTVAIMNPSTEELVAEVAMGSAIDVDRAVAAARAAFPAFSTTSKAQRIQWLERIADIYDRKRFELAKLIACEMGAPLSAVVQSSGPLDHIRYTIKLLGTYEFERNFSGTIIRREAVGVCGLITPWNWPLQTPVSKFCAAFAAGCTVILKPSEYSPLSSLALAEIFDDAALPPGVFNLVNGDGLDVGESLCRHVDVDMISFTGSTHSGIRVAEAAAQTVKRVAQELGGKSANIVLPDADLKEAARWNIGRSLFNAGQSCHAPSRMLVQQDQMAEIEGYLVDAAQAVMIGDPLASSTAMGPVVNKVQFDRVQRFIDIGIKENAHLACGGLGRPNGFDRGFYVKPTVFTDVNPTMTIAREEIFGPVLSVIPYRTEEEALSIANGTPFGLGGYVFSKSREKGRSVSEQLRAGRVFFNGAAGNVMSPMGGYKQSGNGREMGLFGLEEYLEVKSIFGFAPEAESLPRFTI